MLNARGRRLERARSSVSKRIATVVVAHAAVGVDGNPAVELGVFLARRLVVEEKDLQLAIMPSSKQT